MKHEAPQHRSHLWLPCLYLSLSSLLPASPDPRKRPSSQKGDQEKAWKVSLKKAEWHFKFVNMGSSGFVFFFLMWLHPVRIAFEM